MRAVRYHEHGGPGVVQVDDVPRPEPGDDEVLVEVSAASVNPVDGLYRQGVIDPAGLPATVGTDLAGVVAASGDDVSGFAEGDRVFGTGLAGSTTATYAEYAVAPADHLATLPTAVSFEEGAAAAHTGGTAWRSLVDAGELRPTETVLVHGGSGGVGHIAVQIGAATGATVIATAGSETARERVSALGADEVFDYAHDDLEERIVGAAPEGVDVVLDHRLGEYLELDIAVAANRGRILHLSGDVPAIAHPTVTRANELQIQGVAMHNTPDVSGVLRRVARLLETGAVAPIVAETFRLEETETAQRTMTEESFVGKLVVAP